MIYRFAVLCVLVVTMAAAADSSTPSEDVAAIRQARLAQNAAIVRRDTESIARYWTDDVTICRGLGVQLAGKANYLTLFKEDDPTAKNYVVYDRIPTDIDKSTGWPLAFETGLWKGHLGSISGPVVVQGRYSAQWVKRADAWLIRSEVFVALEGAGIGLDMKSAP